MKSLQKVDIGRVWLSLLGLCTLSLLAAAPVTTPDRSLQMGNDAFERGDYEAALNWYTQAEERITDPGHVAFNKATALYRLAQQAEKGRNLPYFREAELHYRRALAGADKGRQGRALFGLANSLVQAREQEVAALAEAIEAYRTCLPLVDESLIPAVRHNLQIARMLWIKARAREAQGSPPQDPPTNDKNSNPPPRSNQGNNPMERGQENTSGSPQSGDQQTGQRPEPGKTPIPTNQLSPGQGNLPPVPDEKSPNLLTTAEADEHLDRALERIWRERRTHRLRSTRTPPSNVKDW